MNAPIDGGGTARARCLLAPNPSPMTLDGTNTWLVAEPSDAVAAVVDPGPDDEAHLRRIAQDARRRNLRIATVLLTHGHSDHSAGARSFAEMTGAPVRALDPVHGLGGEGLTDGEVVAVGGLEIRVIQTPGHSDDSLCFLLPADASLLTGDTVLGRGTTVIAGKGGLADYLASLHRLHELVGSEAVRTILPGHGPSIEDPLGTLDFYLEHRANRLNRVREALEAGDRTADEIVRRVYGDVGSALRPAAEHSVRAQLDYLRQEGSTPPGV